MDREGGGESSYNPPPQLENLQSIEFVSYNINVDKIYHFKSLKNWLLLLIYGRTGREGERVRGRNIEGRRRERDGEVERAFSIYLYG